jgi:hypothetical protein
MEIEIDLEQKLTNSRQRGNDTRNSGVRASLPRATAET